MVDKIQECTIIERLRQVSTCNLSDSMDALGLPRGVISSIKPLDSTLPRMVGRACTLKQASKHGEKRFEDNVVRHMEVFDKIAQSGEVIVIDVNGRLDVSTWGDLNSARSKYRGIAGVIVWGCVRDVEEIKAQQFPVFAAGINPIKSAGDLETIGINIPVEIDGIQVKPNDYIIGDDSGIIVIPEVHIMAVLEKSEEISRKETSWREGILSGKAFGDLIK